MSDRSISPTPQDGTSPERDQEREVQHEALASLIGACVDGELPPETVAQINAHLVGCSRCRREMALQRSVAAATGQIAGPTASAALQTRIRLAVANAPIVPSVRRGPSSASWFTRSVQRFVAIGRARVALLLVGVVVATVWWNVTRANARRSSSAEPSAGGARAVIAPSVTVPPPDLLLDSLISDFQQTAARDLPGRARDLETVRRAIAVPLQPLSTGAAALIGAWTVQLDGELVGVLAYRWQETLLLQYVVSDEVLYRSARIRQAFATGRRVVRQQGSIGVVARPQTRGGTVLMAAVPWARLESVFDAHPSPTP